MTFLDPRDDEDRGRTERRRSGRFRATCRFAIAYTYSPSKILPSLAMNFELWPLHRLMTRETVVVQKKPLSATFFNYARQCNVDDLQLKEAWR